MEVVRHVRRRHRRGVPLVAVYERVLKFDDAAARTAVQAAEEGGDCPPTWPNPEFVKTAFTRQRRVLMFSASLFVFARLAKKPFVFHPEEGVRIAHALLQQAAHARWSLNYPGALGCTVPMPEVPVWPRPKTRQLVEQPHQLGLVVDVEAVERLQAYRETLELEAQRLDAVREGPAADDGMAETTDVPVALVQANQALQALHTWLHHFYVFCLDAVAHRELVN